MGGDRSEFAWTDHTQQCRCGKRREFLSRRDHDNADPQMQLLPENSDLTCVNSWVVNPVAYLVYNDNDHDSKIFNPGLESDNSLSSNYYDGFRAYIDVLGVMEEESNVDFETRSEIESLLKGPAEVKKEMHLMEMICQGKI
ncbi:hypothetical protein TIFTF001_029719 [Ficus carica]|uniref:Uncharacterized protein n=1 Tax=Ficus carica TaxID=3494 RepID=A0AA88DST5_FICCA|nr:hypothetical protein TIFTF001_029719 [Ficus carica]